MTEATASCATHLMLGDKTLRVIRALERVADHRCCPACYFQQLHPYLEVDDKVALYRVCFDCQCENHKDEKQETVDDDTYAAVPASGIYG